MEPAPQKHAPKSTCPALQVWIETRRRELSTAIDEYTTRSATNSSRLSTIRSEIASRKAVLEQHRIEHLDAEQSVAIARAGLQVPQSLRNLKTLVNHGIDPDNGDGFNEMISATTKLFDTLQAQVSALKDKVTRRENNINTYDKYAAALQREQMEIFTGIQAFRDFELQFIKIH